MDAYHIALEEGSVAYLDTQAPYFDGGSGTIWEHIKQSIRFTTQNMGAHGFPLMLSSVQATAELIDSIWTLLSEKGYISQEDALKSDTIGRACVYMHAHLGEKLTAQSVAAYAHISSRHFVRPAAG